MKRSCLILFLLLAVLFLVSGCTGPVEEIVPPTPTLNPEPIYYGEVTFKDNECTVEGPEVIERGTYYFTLINESDDRLEVWLDHLLEDKTIDDLRDWQEEPGVYLSPPPWIGEPGSTHNFDLETRVHFLDQVGDYVIVVGDNLLTILWFCEPFSVIEASSE